MKTVIQEWLDIYAIPSSNSKNASGQIIRHLIVK